MNEYTIKLPLTSVNFDDTELTFCINHIRSRVPSIIYFKLHLYNIDGDEIYYDGSEAVTTTTEVAYTSDRSVIGTAFSSDGKDYLETFNLQKALVDATAYYRLELIFLGVDSENPVYFSEMMFQQGKFSEYHIPNELEDNHYIELPSNMYANLYTSEGDYLQVIRPNRESFNTNKLDNAKYTILAPHFNDDEDYDDHVSVFLEAINQTEQTVDVLR